jgi:dCTP deaminase
MTFWSGETLLARGKALFSDFNEKRIDCNAYVLRMGGRYYLTADKEQSE